ncbi:MAG: SprT-like domain-containing protein [Patescibacteria group bacterium]|nr:SprT-like domain-containing protein [Patescibacteria group bacterium]
MSLHITPEMCEAMYGFLLTTPPFRSWYRQKKLPSSDEVAFHVIASKLIRGDHELTPEGETIIRISAGLVETVSELHATMAHEMIHTYLAVACPGDRAAHGWRFWRAASCVCRHHMLSEKAF